MVRARLLAPSEQGVDVTRREGAFRLSRALPRLTADARRLSANVVAGVHGRRRAGPGETFWQFRSFTPGEPITRIDWRRSARDDRITIRDREWEAAQTLWLWIDRSPSMAFVSDRAKASKIERALVIGLALADMLVRGGERVGLLGLTPPIAQRGVIERLAEALILAGDDPADLPPARPVPARAEAVLVGDFLEPLDQIASRLRLLAERNARGHLVVIIDPAEETFPFVGNNEFVATEGDLRLRVGDSRAFAAAYRERMALHRDGVRRIARDLGWSATTHRTDGSPAEMLLAFHAMLQDGRGFGRGAGAPGGR